MQLLNIHGQSFCTEPHTKGKTAPEEAFGKATRGGPPTDPWPSSRELRSSANDLTPAHTPNTHVLHPVNGQARNLLIDGASNLQTTAATADTGGDQNTTPDGAAHISASPSVVAGHTPAAGPAAASPEAAGPAAAVACQVAAASPAAAAGPVAAPVGPTLPTGPVSAERPVVAARRAPEKTLVAVSMMGPSPTDAGTAAVGVDPKTAASRAAAADPAVAAGPTAAACPAAKTGRASRVAAVEVVSVVPVPVLSSTAEATVLPPVAALLVEPASSLAELSEVAVPAAVDAGNMSNGEACSSAGQDDAATVLRRRRLQPERRLRGSV